MSRHKKYWEMTKAELAESTKEFDQEFVADKARPMTAAEAPKKSGLAGAGQKSAKARERFISPSSEASSPRPTNSPVNKA